MIIKTTHLPIVNLPDFLILFRNNSSFTTNNYPSLIQRIPVRSKQLYKEKQKSTKHNCSGFMEKNYSNYDLDNLDIQILSILMEDASIPYTEIAKKLIVSGGTIHVRMKKMEELGIIHGSNLIINPQKVGFDITAFLGIFLEKGSQYSDAVEQLKQVKEVVELHYCTGSYSMFAKIICKDTAHLRKVLNEDIQGLKGIQRTETIISLEESIKRQITL